MNIQSLRSRLSSLESEKKRLEKRKSAVQNIVKKIGKKPVDNLQDSKNYAEKAASCLNGSCPDGISGSSHIRVLADNIQRKARSGFGLDNWTDKDNLNREVNRLESEITSLSQEIQRVRAQIEQAEREALTQFFSIS